MMQHIHYGDWTIEWEYREEGGYDFWICGEQREPRIMNIQTHRYWVKTSLNLDEALGDCHGLIKEITDRQQRVLMDTILSFHDKHRSPAPQQEVEISEIKESDRIPF